jgi:hypothetical protein
LELLLDLRLDIWGVLQYKAVNFPEKWGADEINVQFQSAIVTNLSSC